MLIDENCVVTLSYQLFTVDENKKEISIEDRSVDDPLEFLFGQGVLLPKVEETLRGKTHGFKAEIELHPRDAFGLHREELQTWMDRSKFPKDLELELGMKFQTQGPAGKVLSVIVKDIKDDKVLVDGNHPLAGLSLKFVLNVLRVRKATDQELAKQEVDPTLIH